MKWLTTFCIILEAGFNVASTLVMAKHAELKKGSNGNHVLSLSDQEGLSKALAKNSVNESLIQELSSTVLGGSWSRSLEEEADLLALDLIISAGYSKNVARAAIQRIGASQAGAKSRMDKFTENRKQALTSAFQTNGLDGVLNQGSELMVSGVLEAKDALLDKFGSQHASPEDRENYIQAYANREYRRARKVVPSKAHLKARSHPFTTRFTGRPGKLYSGLCESRVSSGPQGGAE